MQEEEDAHMGQLKHNLVISVIKVRIDAVMQKPITIITYEQ
jgi:hypothetical protein